MTGLKPVYLLAGGRGGQASDSIIKAIFQDINEAVPKIAYVGAASNDDRNFFRFMGKMIARGGECNLVQVFLCSEKTDFRESRAIMESAEAVFLSGGDVEAGMEILTQRGLTGFFRELYQQGKLFFGASAGSIMLAREWVRWRDPEDDSTAELFPCLNIAPVLCDTHAEEDDWEELKAALRLKEDGSAGYGIPTGGCLKVLPDGQLITLGEAAAYYLKRGKRVIRQRTLKS